MGWYDNKKPEIVEQQQPGGDVPKLLRDFRHVADNPNVLDKTEGHRDARKFKEENYAKFALQLAAMEKEYRKGDDDSGGGKEEEADIGTEKCVELCERLIGAILAKQK